MVKRGNCRSRLATIMLSFVLLFGASFLTSHMDMSNVYAATVSNWGDLKAAVGGAVEGEKTEIEINSSFPYDGTSIEIPATADITLTGTGTIYSYSSKQNSEQDKYDSMFKVKGKLTIGDGVTLSGKIGDDGTQCPDRTSETPTYTEDKFSGGYADGAKTYTPKGFFIDVEVGGTATLNGTISDFITSGNKETTPRYVAPVVANGTGATFNLGANGVIKNNLVGYIVDDDMAYTDAQTIKQYVKGAPPNSLRVPGSAEQKSHPDKYERTRNRNAGIDGNADEDLGSGITGTAGAVIYKDGAQGEILGKIDNNRGDTGGVMASGDGTVVHIKGANISRNVGVQFGGGSTTEQGAMIAMHSGTMKQNVAWFGGGAVYATENGVDWLLGKIVEADGKPDFDARKDGKFTMKNGRLEENTAFTRGGAILVDSDGVTVKSGKLKNNMSWMLGGAVYVMGDHPKYTYTMRIDPVYVHDNTAVSGLKEARDQAALEGEKTSADLEADNAKLQRKLAAPSGCAGINETDDLFTAEPISDHNTDDRTDGKGNDGTGGGVWLCPYGSVFFDAEKTGNVVIYSNYATGTTKDSAKNADAKYNSNKSPRSRSKISGGSDLHTDQGKQDGGVTISGLASGGWINENNDQPYMTETSSNRTNLVSTREPQQAGDVPNKYQDGEYVEVTGNIARRGGGLASDGKFYFGPAPSLAGINAKMTVGKEWTAAAKTEPIAIRVSVKKGSVEHVVADVPLDGVANGPVSEFDTVSELKPVGNLWTGEFSLPLVVTDDNGNDPIQLYELYYKGELIDITKLSGREALGELVKTNEQGNIEIRQATDVEIIYKEMNVKRDDGGNWVVDGEHGTHVFTPDSVDFSKLKFTVEEREDVKEKYIDGEGNLAEETVYGIYTLGLALKMESGNDNEPIVEKYVNKKVHADIVNFDQDFTYDVMAYVPYKATEITIEDTLVEGLEFADKNGNNVTDRSTVESITVKPMNDHKPNGTVSEDAMKNPSNPNFPYELKDSSNHTEISIEDNKISVTIRNIQQEKDSTSYESHPSELKGRWVRLTFHARIKDEYRSIEALKALQDSWLDKDDSKTGSGPHDVSFENPDKVLIKPVLEAKKDTIVWAVEGPQRLFARTVSGAYFATEDKENGTGWVKLDQGSDLWNNADRRYRGQAKDTKRELDIENADSALVAALEDSDEIKRFRPVRGAEGGTKLFVEIESISSGDKEVYQTPDSDKKQGHTWDKLEPGTGDYNNAINVMNGANNTVRKFDFESEAVSLKGDGLNWPVITEEKHEGMSNQAGYQVMFGNNASAKLKSNIVTVVPETTELDVIKKWAPNGKWPDDVKNVKFNVFSKKGNVVKQVYVDGDGNVVGAFEDGDQNIPADAKKLTVTLSEDDPATDKDESKTTVKGLPKLIGTTYIARETEITYIEGGEDKTAAVDYLDDTYKTGTAKLGEGAAAETVFVSVDSSYKGNGAKLKKLKLTNAIPVRGAIAQNRLWALASNGDYYFTAENDTDGTADSSQWTKIEKPAGNADPNSGGVKNYAFAQKILGKIDANGRFSTVEDEDLDNDKIEELDQPTVFDVTNEITATNEKAFEKYVNNDVHADLKEFDKAFKYDIMVYVPAGSTKLTITDPLASALEFAKKKDSLDAAEKTAAEKAADAGETIESVIYKAKNDHKAGSTVAGKDENNPATAIAATDYKASIADNTLLIEFEGAEDPDNVGKKLPVAFAGNWVQVTFWAKYTDEIIKAADAGDFDTIRDNGAVISEKYPNVAQDAAEDEFSHEGTVNKASAKISVGNDYNFDLASNEVTVKPETEKLWVQKKWQNEEGEELNKWPKGMTVKINVYKNAKGSEAEVVETLEVSSFEPVSSKTYPKLVGVTYSVDEVEVPEKYAKLDEITGDGSEEKPFVITNAARKYTGVEITKKWVGATMDEIPSGEDFKTYLVLKDGEGKDVSEEYADKLTVTVKGSTYKAKWVGLPDGKYTVEEKAIPGFDTEVNGSTITNKKKPSGEKPEIEKYVNQAVHKDITLDEVFTYDIIAYVTKDADSVTITDKLHDMLTFDGDASHVAVVDLGEADNHLVTNNISGVKVNKNASVAQKGKPVEGAKVEINGQTLKVFITNKLKKTTAKGEDAYTPVEIESVNPKEKGYYELIEDEYVPTEDTVPAVDKTYYVKETPEESDSQPSFSAVTIETVNPSEKGYYEYSSYEYVPTKDERPDPDTTYYVKAEGQVEEADGYEYDGENQPVTALRGHWVKVTFNAKINGKTLEEVKKKYENIKVSDVDDSRDPENIGNAPVISVEDHTGLPNDASYTIGVANEAGIQEDVHKDKSNIVTVKPDKDEPTVKKLVNDGKTLVIKDANKVFHYTITSKVPYEAKSFKLYDNVPAKLAIVKKDDIKITVNGKTLSKAERDSILTIKGNRLEVVPTAKQLADWKAFDIKVVFYTKIKDAASLKNNEEIINEAFINVDGNEYGDEGEKTATIEFKKPNSPADNEDKGKTKKKPAQNIKTAKTGDDFNPYPAIYAMLASLLVIAALARRRKSM